MDIVWKGKAYSHVFQAQDFEGMAAALVERLREPVLRALRDSDIRPSDLSEIVLVGGATRMPIVRRTVTRMFDRFPSHAVNPDEAVALGAAVQAGLKSRDAALREIAVTDVCPYSLGVDVSERLDDGGVRGGLFSPIIERNIVVPVSRQRVFSTLQDGQQAVRFGIYQGESRHVADNILLSEISIPVPPRPAGHVAVECRFTYDINGLIEVDVHVPMTGERRELVIVDEDGPKGDDLERQRAALAALKVHPRDLDANRAAMARANRCYEDFLGDKRAFVGQLIGQFESILEGQDPRQIDHARTELMRALDSLEGESFL